MTVMVSRQKNGLLEKGYTLFFVGVCLLLTGCKPTISFDALESVLIAGHSTTLNWDVDFPQGASEATVKLSPHFDAIEEEGSIIVTPDKTTTYRLSTRNSMFGFPLYIDEELTIEVKDGEFWDFSDTSSVADWAFDSYGYLEDEVEHYNLVIDGSAIEPVESKQSMRLSMKHSDPEEVTESAVIYGKIRKGLLESSADYNITVIVNYSIGVHRDAEQQDCTQPVLTLSANASVTEPVVEVDEIDRVILANSNEGNKKTLSDDMTINDSLCDDDVFEINAATTGENPIKITTTSEGEVWLSLSLSASIPEFDIYINTISAFFEQQ